MSAGMLDFGGSAALAALCLVVFAPGAPERMAASVYGVGLDPNIVTATLKAVTAAVNRACAHGALSLGTPVGAAA